VSRLHQGGNLEVSHNSRTPKLLALFLAVPIIGLVYASAILGRFARIFRPALTPVVGVSIISTTFAAQALRSEPAKRPARATVAIALAIALVAPAVSNVPVAAAADPQDVVVRLTMDTVGSAYVFGAEGPTKFDCSGLVYWVFKKAGELPRIGGSRMGARSYMRWFVARGRWSKDEADARPGDLVVWGDGHHIGVYIGPNRAVSALNPRLGVRVHDLKIPHAPTQFLLINWGRNDGGDNGGGDNGGGDNGGGDNGGGDNGGGGSDVTPTPAPDDGASSGNGASNGDTGFDPPAATPGPTDAPAPTPKPKPDTAQPPETVGGESVAVGQAITAGSVGTLPAATRANPRPSGANGVAIATVNLRELPDATSRILGWVGNGGYVTIVSTAFSPQGNLYYQVTTASGASGWVYSHWVLRTP
jgi:cell wall-associated NlpC family hydrolase